MSDTSVRPPLKSIRPETNTNTPAKIIRHICPLPDTGVNVGEEAAYGYV